MCVCVQLVDYEWKNGEAVVEKGPTNSNVFLLSADDMGHNRDIIEQRNYVETFVYI